MLERLRSEVRYRLRALFRRSRMEHELDDELAYHLEREAEKLVDAGMQPVEARRAARLAFGGVDRMKEFSRDARGVRWLELIRQDVRLALRQIRADRAFAAIVIVTLAVAIGANTAIFSVVESVLLRPLPYSDADRIVTVRVGLQPGPGVPEDQRFADRGFWHFVRGNRAFETFAGYVPFPLEMNLTGDGDPQHVEVGRMTTSAFDVLGVLPQRGRLPTVSEGVPGAPDVILLSDGLWRDRYGSDAGIIGRTITLNGEPYEVIGIMPRRYDFPAPDLDAWTPLRLDPASNNFGIYWIEGLANLAPGTSLSEATADAEGLISRLGEAGYPPLWISDVFDGSARVTSIRETIVGDATRPLLILMGTVGFVLLIACGNVANLMLVRAEGRRRESAVRLALGAGRGRLIQHQMVESVILAFAGGAAGVLLAFVGTRLLVLLGPSSIPRLGEVGVRAPALLFTTGVCVCAGLIVGLLPALRSTAHASLAVLRDGGRGSTAGRERNRARNALVIAQLALSLVLLVGSGLLLRSFEQLRDVDPGFDADGLLTFRVRPLSAKYGGAEGVARFYDRLLDDVASIPGVASAGAITHLPLTGGGAEQFRVVEEVPPPAGEVPPLFHIRRATPGYFETMGVPVIEGRPFTRDDHRLRTGSILISRSVKERYWPSASAVGKRISDATVVGVVGDVHDGSLDTAADRIIYYPMLDSAGGGVGAMTMVVRAGIDPLAVLPGVRSRIEALDPDLPISDVRTMSDIVGESLSRTRYTMSLLGIAAAIALLLACVGIYGVISHSVKQRTTEIGIRLALGASPRRIRHMVLFRGLRLAAAGTGIGLLGAAGLSGVLTSLLFGIEAMDGVTLLCASMLFLAVAGAACAVPAARAARVPPADALR